MSSSRSSPDRCPKSLREFGMAKLVTRRRLSLSFIGQRFVWPCDIAVTLQCHLRWTILTYAAPAELLHEDVVVLPLSEIAVKSPGDGYGSCDRSERRRRSRPVPGSFLAETTEPVLCEQPSNGRHSPPSPPARWSARRCTRDRKSTRLNSSHSQISYAVFCLKKKNTA